ncbi:methionyl-tRNA formyltransferase [Oxalobacter paraformigenes]|uniref:Methionyl-tRNA formyltransferase n=1 Tax=Oxalobacter paraformigenes TaxID=556268 RepID=C3X5C3_9BURK|nr:methionyl-tRNA formyltransferase [Oxalobacter paraformigenes]EEO28409.1 methionyl-tRNA formyltransferase [Oxalobacter paraformigenes]
MKIVFAGTPEFASTALNALVRAGHQIGLVLTQPDRPSGRGMKLQASAVKKLAVSEGIPVEQPVSLRLDGRHGEEAKKVYERIARIEPDVMVVVAYGLILPKVFLELPKYGCLNIHASLLPRWRGAAPIQRAIEAGDEKTGVSIMQMEEGLDTGPVLLKETVAIEKDDNASRLHDKLADLGSRLILSALNQLAENSARFTVQDEDAAIYAAKIRKEEATVNFTFSATEIVNKIRAFDPFPGCIAKYRNIPIKIWKAENAGSYPGTKAGQIVSVNESGIVVGCVEDSVRILELQKPGGKRLSAAEFIKGFSFENGCFE